MRQLQTQTQSGKPIEPEDATIQPVSQFISWIKPPTASKNSATLPSQNRNIK